MAVEARTDIVWPSATTLHGGVEAAAREGTRVCGSSACMDSGGSRHGGAEVAACDGVDMCDLGTGSSDISYSWDRGGNTF